MTADNDWLLGPNAVEAQLETDPTRILEILVEDGKRNPRVDGLVQQLRGLGIAVQRIPRAQFDKRVGSDRHQGIAARWRLPEGLDENDLLALVEKATLPGQRTVAGTLATLPQRALDENVQAPALIVVGSVVELHRDFDWFERRPEARCAVSA